MATQLHIAFSSIFSGVGLVAGRKSRSFHLNHDNKLNAIRDALAPYYCATGVMTSALTTCMSSTVGPNSTTLINKVEEYNKKGDIDDTNNLKNHRVYIYTGKKDTTVQPGKLIGSFQPCKPGLTNNDLLFKLLPRRVNLST